MATRQKQAGSVFSFTIPTEDEVAKTTVFASLLTTLEIYNKLFFFLYIIRFLVDEYEYFLSVNYGLPRFLFFSMVKQNGWLRFPSLVFNTLFHDLSKCRNCCSLRLNLIHIPFIRFGKDSCIDKCFPNFIFVRYLDN